MANTIANNKRIAKNTILLYIRMVFLMVVGLFTTRVILDSLGAEDYGLYNVVGGFVSMFSVISAGLSSATQRFLSFYLGKGDMSGLNKTFSSCVYIFIALSLLIIIIAEICGIWFLENKLTIPEERLYAAHWVFHLSLLTLTISLISTPYNALIVAHEKMKAFAYISIVEAVAKLAIAYMIYVTSFDKLIVYAALLCGVQLFIRFLYNIYCNRHFPESTLNKHIDRVKIKEIYSFTGWSVLGGISYMGRTQGLNIILNIFFGSIVNAARGISVQIQGAINGFVSNFQMALNPQIVKTYSQNDLLSMRKLVYRSSKFSFCLLFFFALPIMMETEYILSVWLKATPEHTANFIRLLLVISMIDAISNPLVRSIEASGKIKMYQIICSILLLCVIPLSYVALKIHAIPELVYWISLAFYLITLQYRICLSCKILECKPMDFYRNVILKVLTMSSLSFAVSLCLSFCLEPSFLRFFIVCIISMVSTLVLSFCIVMDKNERQAILKNVKRLKTNTHGS